MKCAKFILHLLCDQTRTSLLIVAVGGHTLLAYTMNAHAHYLKCQTGDSFVECLLSCVERLLFMVTHTRAREHTPLTCRPILHSCRPILRSCRPIHLTCRPILRSCRPIHLTCMPSHSPHMHAVPFCAHAVPFSSHAVPFCALACLLYTSPSPRDLSTSRMPSSA